MNADGAGQIRIIPIDTKLKSLPENVSQHRKVSVRNVLCSYAKRAEGGLQMRDPVCGEKIPAFGSEEMVFVNGNFGFFSTILEAYNNHWTVQMCPEDWFYTIIERVSEAIDRNSKNENVRKFFVRHGGKKTLLVRVPDATPLTVDYSWFLDQMLSRIRDDIKVPNYVNLMTSDFSTSTKTHRIVSSIVAMKSVQEYFEYRLMCGCGIPTINMTGTVHDWEKLKGKVIGLKNLLAPIQKHIEKNLPNIWWSKMEAICEKLIVTHQGSPDILWWHNIICRTEEKVWGPSGMAKKSYPVFNGWFIKDILGFKELRVDDLQRISNPLVFVPMIIDHPIYPSEESAFVAGIAGYRKEEIKGEAWPRISAVHAWTLLLKPDSVYLPILQDLEKRTKGA